MLTKKISVYCLMALLLGLAQTSVSDDGSCPSESCFVSLVKLVAYGERYDKSKIVIRGVFFSEGEHAAVYLDSGSMKYGIDENAVYIHLRDVQDPSLLTGKYVIVEGQFDSKDKGISGIFAGSLKSIIRIHPTPGESVKRQDNKP